MYPFIYSNGVQLVQFPKGLANISPLSLSLLSLTCMSLATCHMPHDTCNNNNNWFIKKIVVSNFNSITSNNLNNKYATKSVICFFHYHPLLTVCIKYMYCIISQWLVNLLVL